MRKRTKLIVLEVFAGPVAGDESPLIRVHRSRIPLTLGLTLCVHVRRPEAKISRNAGDLDNFVAGVCDGLMGLGKYPHPSQELAPMFCDRSDECRQFIHCKPIAYRGRLASHGDFCEESHS